MRLLLVEDNDRLSEFLEKALHDSGFTVDRCASATDADAALAGVKFDATIMDLGLPDGDGLGLVKSMRTRGDQTPVLILTARDALNDRVGGLNGGADDYMVKPFAMEELIARVKALLRRPGAALGVELTLGNVCLDTTGPNLTVAGKPVALTRREVTLLEILLRRLGVGRLVLTGIAGNICVLFTANDAYMRDYEVVVPRDCTACNYAQDMRYLLRHLEAVFGIPTTPSKRLRWSRR